jgi:hydrogenase maturation factor
MWVIQQEREVMGVWTTPEKAVCAYLGIGPDEVVDEGWFGAILPGMTVSEVVEVMTAKYADYPILTKIPVDPRTTGYGGEAWCRDS